MRPSPCPALPTQQGLGLQGRAWYAHPSLALIAFLIPFMRQSIVGDSRRINRAPFLKAFFVLQGVP